MLTLIETTDLCKQYGKTMRVNSLNLRIPEGAVYGFLGPNGAGKSTTLKMILGLTHPTRGEISIFGKPAAESNRIQLLKNVGSLIEAPSYYGHLTGEENLRIVQTLRNRPAREVGEVLALVRLGGAKDKKVAHYSLGMNQRLGLAAAMLGYPKLLILDEPTNGLDPAGIQEMRELIRSLPERYGMTVVVSSHLLSEIDQMATDVGIISNGNLVFQDALPCLHERSEHHIAIRTGNNPLAAEFLRQNGISCDLNETYLSLPPLDDALVAQCNALLCQKNIPVLRIEERQKSLEEIFLDLTEGAVSL